MTVRNLAYIAMFTTLLIVLGFIPGIPLGFIPVPIVLQNFGVMLAGVVLGKRGSLAVLLMMLVGIALPVFSGASTTFSVLIGPTAGYVVAWIFVPFLVAWGLKMAEQKPVVIFLVIWLAGVLFVDLFGAIWLTHYSKISLTASLVSNLAFIPGDTLKALLATFIAVKYRHLRTS